MQKWIAQDCEREQFSKAEAKGEKSKKRTGVDDLGKATRKITG